MTLENSHGQIKALKDAGTIMKWASDEQKKEIDMVLETLTNIKEGLRTPTKYMTSEWLKKVAAIMPNFARFESSEKGKTTMFVGAQAAEKCSRSCRQTSQARSHKCRSTSTRRYLGC